MLSSLKKRLPDQEPQREVETPTNESKPTRNQLWRWCLRADAVAQCYIRDVMQLKGNPDENKRDSDFIWWLGSVPCRNVKFVGMLVGAKAYEKRTIYTIDDGTDVIQCLHFHPQLTKFKQKHQSKFGSSILKQPPLIRESDFPTPRYEVGDILRVSGRVEAWHDTRQIVINDIQLCWANDEPEHWITTAKLHKSYYSQPFVIPPLPLPPVPQTPVKRRPDASTFTTPSTTSSVPTPSTAVSSSSVCETSKNGPSRLRHPSRLRSKELITSTFKIYLKNYIDLMSDPSRLDPLESWPLSGYASPLEESPTKRSKYNADDETATPRPRDRHSRVLHDLNTTPRPLQRNAKHRNTNTPTHQPRLVKGFTLSYLRRVPELADMAHRVVEVERRRRHRELRQMQKEAARTGKEITLPKQPPAEPTGRKAKRLYTWTLRELRKEGSIILNEDDAPVWEFPELAKASAGIWKTSATFDSANTTALSINLTNSTADENRPHWDPGELSDPPVREESYIPLTPVMLMKPIIDAIKGFMIAKPHATRPTAQPSTGTYRSSGTAAAGPTAEDLREYLSNVDARWESVGEYTIKDALDLLQKEDKIYRVGNGRWELSI